MSNHVTLSPVSRIEGHLSVHTETEALASGDTGDKIRVKEAWCEGEMFRGLEKILEGRDPLDAQQITQRICGVCPVSHGIASILRPRNGLWNYSQLQWTHFAKPDFRGKLFALACFAFLPIGRFRFCGRKSHIKIFRQGPRIIGVKRLGDGGNSLEGRLSGGPVFTAL